MTTIARPSTRTMCLTVERALTVSLRVIVSMNHRF
jgi:hypothetical protein